MLTFVTINIDEEYREWRFNSIEELRKMWWAEDYVGPGSDDPVTEMEFHGVPMYVNCFEDIVQLFGLEAKNATFTSVWDGGYEITTNCKVNMETKEVFDIEMAEGSYAINVLDAEFVTIDGIDYPASNDDTTEYWYR